MSSGNSVITDGKKPSASSRSSKSTDEDSASPPKNKDSVHGHIFQLQLLMLFLCRGVKRGYSFRLGTEVIEAGKFDDLVFQYDGTNGSTNYILLQAKHKKDGCKRISADELVTKSDGDYSLIKYFNSYHESKEKELFKDGTIENIFICTNIDMDFEGLSKKGIMCEGIYKGNEILTHKDVEKQAAQYKFNEDVVSLLKPQLHDYPLTVLADKLIEHFHGYESIRYHQKPFKDYHEALAKDVIDVKNKKLFEKFIKSDRISEPAVKFRDAFKKAIEHQFKGAITLENFNAKIDNKEFGFNLPRHFGKSKNHEKKSDWPDNLFSDDDIKEYLNRLVFAVNQPDDKRLGKIISNEIGEELNRITTKNMYNEMFVKMMGWMQDREKKFLSSEDGKKLLDVAKAGVSIWFNVSDPVGSFTGRTEKLRELHEVLKGGDTAIAQIACIGGLGGVGKSELARKYVHEYSKDYDHNVIWINAETRQSLAESFHKLAQTKLDLKTVDSNDKGKDTVSIVEEVYRFFSKGERSLFIFDNAVQLRSTNDGNEGIKEYLPSLPSNCRRPHILITSRNLAWKDITVLALDVFTEKEAVEFIRKTLQIKENGQTDAAIDLAKKLQYFPLALHQAVAYIEVTDGYLKNLGEEFIISDYLERYETKTGELLDFPFPPNSDISYEKTTYTTWDITIESIRDKKYRKKASEILDIAAYFVPDCISSRIFLNLNGTDKEELGCIIEMLKQYSMVKTGADKSLLSIHRLVQHVTRLKQKASGREIECIRTALTLFEDPVRRANDRTVDLVERHEIRFENLSEDTDSVDQARSVMNYASKHGELVRDFVDLPGRIVERLRHLFRYREARLFGDTMLKVLERYVGPDSVETSELMKKTAMVILDQGQYETALGYFEKVKSTQGDKIPVHNYVGSILRVQRKFDEAIEAFQKTIEMNYSSTDSFQARHNIGKVMIDQNRYEEALKILRTLLHERENDLNHMNIAEMNSTMASALEKQDRYAGALGLYRRAHEEFLKCPTPETRITALNTRFNIARMEYHLRRYESCLDIFREILEEREKLVPDHPSTSETKCMIVLALLQLDRVDDAVEILNKMTDESIETCIKSDNLDLNATYFDQIIQLAAERGSLEAATIVLKEGADPFKPTAVFHMDGVGPSDERVAVSLENDDTIQSGAVEPLNDTIGVLDTRNMNITHSIPPVLYNSVPLLDIRKTKCEFEIIAKSILDPINVDDKATMNKVAAIHIAVQKGHIAIVNLFLKKDPTVDVRTANQLLTPLHFAAKYGHSDIVQSLLEKDAQIDAITEDHLTSLHIAVLNGHSDIVKTLLKHGARIDAMTKDKFTPLHVAAQSGHSYIVETLLEKDAQIDAKTVNDATSLHLAAIRGYLDTVRILLAKGAQIDAITKGHFSSLHIAAHDGYSDIVQILLAKGAQIDAITEDHFTSLHFAVLNGHSDIVKTLLKHGARIDAMTKDKFTPLHVAAQSGHSYIVETLLEKDAQIDAKTVNDATSLHLAAIRGYLDTVRILLAKGAQIDAITKDHSTPLHLATVNGHSDIVEILLAKGAQIDAITKVHSTPLHLAADKGHSDIVEILLAKGARIDARTEDHRTSLHLAARINRSDIVQILLAKGAQIDASTEAHWTSLHIAAHDGYSDIVQILLAKGAQIDAFTEKHLTSLHFAAHNGHSDIVETLLKHGARINAMTKDKVTSLHVAAQNGHSDIVRILLAKGAQIDAITEDHRTSLHFAANYGYSDIVQILLAKDAQIDAFTERHWTSLHFAAHNGHSDIVRILLAKGAQIDAITEDHRTSLHFAANYGYSDIVQILLAKGAQIDAFTERHWTSLHFAAHNGHSDIVRILLAEGAPIDEKTVNDATSLNLAAMRGHMDVVKILVAKGAKVDAIHVHPLAATVANLPHSLWLCQ